MKDLDVFDGSILIVPKEIKRFLLEIKSDHPELNFKILTKEDVFSSIYGQIDDGAILALIDEECDYLSAKKIISFLKAGAQNKKVGRFDFNYYRKRIEELGYYYKDESSLVLFKNKDIYIFDYPKSDVELDRILNSIDHGEVHRVKLKEFFALDKPLKLAEFDDLKEELKYALNLFLKRSDIADLSFIYSKKEAEFYLKAFLSSKEIKGLNSNKKVSEVEYFKGFIRSIDDGKSFNECVNEIPVNDASSVFIERVKELNGSYSFDSLINRALNVKEILEDSKLDEEDTRYIFLDHPVFSKRKKYFLIDFDSDSYPSIYKDDDILSDNEKLELGLSTSDMKNALSVSLLEDFLETMDIEWISYHDYDGGLARSACYSLRKIAREISTYELPILEEEFSPSLAKLFYSTYRYKKERYLYSDERYEIYRDTFGDLARYDHRYERINFTLPKEVNLSYTDVETFYSCPFKYYCKKILGLTDSETSDSQIYGEYLHKIMSCVYNEKINFEQAAKSFDVKLDSKRKVLLKRILAEAREAFELTREHKADEAFVGSKEEYGIKVPFEGFTLLGRIDSLVLLTDNYFYIVDYKSGFFDFDEKKFEYGLDLQLPIYAYLAHCDETLKEMKPLGLYIQPLKLSTLIPLEEIVDNKGDLALKGMTYRNQTLIEKYLDKGFGTRYTKSAYLAKVTLDAHGLKEGPMFFDDQKLAKFYSIVERKTSEMYKAISLADFPIAPYRKSKNDEGCLFCPYFDICYKDYRDYRQLGKVVDSDESEEIEDESY
jgi:CRISPR/Cas system-associated exonuclease Cas4 (RecB family)